MTPPDPGPPQSAVQHRPYPEPPVFSLPGDWALRGLEDKGGKERKLVPSLGDTGGHRGLDTCSTCPAPLCSALSFPCTPPTSS